MKWPLTLIDGTPSILSKTTYCWLIWTKSQVYWNSGAADKDSRRFSTFHHHFLETKNQALLPLEPWVTPQKKVAWLRTVGEIPMNFSPKKYGRFLKWTYPQLSSIYRWIFHHISTIFGVATFSETPISKNDRNSSRFPPATASVVKRLNRPWQVAPGQAEQGPWRRTKMVGASNPPE